MSIGSATKINDAKESLLQIITQIITNPNSTGSIIALKGPPGVGKTSIIFRFHFSQIFE